MGPPVRPGEVHQPPGGQRRHHPLLDLVFELLPAFIGDRGVGTEEMVHWAAPLRLADTERPGVLDRLAARRFLLLDDGSGREQVGAQVLVQHGVLAAQPLEDHRRMLFLLIPVVGENGGQFGIVGGADPLVVPVDRLQLLLDRGQRPVPVDDLGGHPVFGFVQSRTLGHASSPTVGAGRPSRRSAQPRQQTGQGRKGTPLRGRFGGTADSGTGDRWSRLGPACPRTRRRGASGCRPAWRR